MNRRHATDRPTPAFTSGEDRPRTPCAGRWDVYESLHGRYSADPEAIEAARNMCGTCLLTMPDIARACLSAAKDERWRAHVLSKPAAVRKPSVGAWEAFNNDRLADVQRCVKEGLSADEAAARLGLTRNGLWTWCDRQGHKALYAQLRTDERRGNQYRKSDLGTITIRRSKRAA